MNGTCSQTDCGVKDGLTCELGHTELNECPHFGSTVQSNPKTEVAEVIDEIIGQRLPWTGRALGLNDMMLASARSAPTLVGLIGPYNAGKTAFLTSLYLHFAKTAVIDTFAFAGSYSLTAWGRLKQFTSWPDGFGPAFPPHTPDLAERVPSLLHLAFRKGNEPIRDVLFTDAPGEWFSRWIQNQNSADARGATWISDHATHFLFFVDRDGLASASLGKVRQDTLMLARILSERKAGRPVILVWAKKDKPCPPDVVKAMNDKFQKLFGPHLTFEVDVKEPTCLELLKEILVQTPKPTFFPTPLIPETRSAFFAYKGSS